MHPYRDGLLQGGDAGGGARGEGDEGVREAQPCQVDARRDVGVQVNI